MILKKKRDLNNAPWERFPQEELPSTNNEEMTIIFYRQCLDSDFLVCSGKSGCIKKTKQRVFL